MYVSEGEQMHGGEAVHEPEIGSPNNIPVPSNHILRVHVCRGIRRAELYSMQQFGCVACTRKV